MWISAEGRGVVELLPSAGAPPTTMHGVEASVLGLVSSATARDARLLGYVHPHGTTLDWRA